mmetsp:Transcript_20917/g.19973  ORF Transcript_20917/g.19973 Transcript_20917/m.19973 type:complete len:489 (-) Transcript_20917:574-2040(-)
MEVLARSHQTKQGVVVVDVFDGHPRHQSQVGEAEILQPLAPLVQRLDQQLLLRKHRRGVLLVGLELSEEQVHSGLFQLVEVTELDEDVVGVLVGEGEVHEVLHEARQLIEDQVAVGLEVVQTLLLLVLEHPFQLAEAHLEDVLLRVLVLQPRLRLPPLELAPVRLLHLHGDRVLDAILPDLRVLPDPVVAKDPRQEGLPVVVHAVDELGALEDHVYHLVVNVAFMHEQCEDELDDVCDELQAVVGLDELGRVDLAQNLRQHRPDPPVMHQLDQVPLLLNRDALRHQQPLHLLNQYPLVVLERFFLEELELAEVLLRVGAFDSAGAVGALDVVVIHHRLVRGAISLRKGLRFPLNMLTGPFLRLLLEVVVVLELFSEQEVVFAFVVVDEDLDVGVAGDGVEVLVDLLAAASELLAELVELPAHLLEVVLHEVDAGIIALLDSVQDLHVGRLEHINGQVELVQTALVLVLGDVSLHLLLLELLVLDASGG